MTAPAQFENGIKVRRIRCDECGESVSSPFVSVEADLGDGHKSDSTFIMSAYVLCCDCFEKMYPKGMNDRS